MLLRTLSLAAALVVFSLAGVAQAEEKARETAITIYSKATPGAIDADMYRPVPGQGYNYGYQQIPGYAIVRHKESMGLLRKRNNIKFSDVAALIDPTTVTFKSLSDPDGTSVVEQNYLFDLVNQQKLLQRFINQTITVEQSHGDVIESYEGDLLSASGGITLKNKKGEILSLTSYSNIRFPDLPGGLITTPTLEWDIATGRLDTHVVEVSYQTGGITWWTDYNAVFEDGKTANEGFLDLSAWVSILNMSGAKYEEARLKLVAGDVHRAEPVMQKAYGRGAMVAMEMADAAAPGFEQKDFFEFHLYTLGRPATIPDHSTKQLELFPSVARIPAEKKLIYRGSAMQYYGYPQMDQHYGQQGNTDVEVYLAFDNRQEHGLGVPLPAGRLRVNKRDSDGSLEFIGEDIIDHTPKDEEVLLKMGNAFDVKGERKQTNFSIDTARKTMEESIEILIKNHKKQDVTVTVVEQFYRAANWQLLDFTGKYEKKDAFTVEFPVTVRADAEEKVRYTVKYTW